MLPFKGKYPKLDPKSHAMPGAELAGDVELAVVTSVVGPSSVQVHSC